MGRMTAEDGLWMRRARLGFRRAETGNDGCLPRVSEELRPYLREDVYAGDQFDGLGTRLTGELDKVSICQKSSFDIEIEFREMREKERQHTASKLGKQAR